MIEIIIANRRTFDAGLLTGVSALALLAGACLGKEARAADVDHEKAAVWIELGFDYSRISGGHESFAPSFAGLFAQEGFKSPLEIQNALSGAYGGAGAISFHPVDSSWVFAAAIRYGRAKGQKELHQQTKSISPQHFQHSIPAIGNYFSTTIDFPLTRIAETKAENAESHVIADFTVGRDVGLGMFGSKSTANVGFGVRFAQFSSRSEAQISGNPDAHIGQYHRTDVENVNCHRVGRVRICDHATGYYSYPVAHWHNFSSADEGTRSFRGLGPALSWNASSRLAGNDQDGELMFDWGLNGAVLFGKQKARGHHHTSASYWAGKYSNVYQTRPLHPPVYHDRSRTLVVPNVGGFAGFSVRYPAARISLGYRADFFFNAVDGGVDSPRKENRGFFGPFASIAVGLGE